MKYFSLFSGIGGFEYGFEKAVQNNVCVQRSKYQTEDTGCFKNSRLEPKRTERLGCVGFSEIDKYATSICKKHFPNHKEYGNVSNITWSDVSDFEMLCGGFPCQSFSIAGKRLGFDDIRGTLFFEIVRAAQEKQPRLLLLENVKGLLSHDKGRTFGTILNTLDELGYDLQWQVLNSKNFGVPQNRERVFIIGHLRTTRRPQVFPFRKSNKETNDIQRQRILSNTVKPDFSGSAACTYVEYQELPQIRRLTPTECERLQGFPDGWTEKGLTNVQTCGNIKYIDRRYICDRFVGLRTAIENSYHEKTEFASYTIKDSNGEERQINISHQKENATIVDKMLLREISVSNIINLGNGMVTLYNLRGIYNNVEQIKKNLTREKMGNHSILPVWRIYLKESWNQKRLSTISTWINEITKNPIFTYVGTEKPITNVIIHWNWLQPNYIKGESFDLKMGNIISISDTQRYKCLGNAVTTTVITAIAEKLLFST